MGYVVSLSARPHPRYDNTSWTTARVEESEQEAGPFTLVEEFALTPDPNPAEPQRRNLTTEEATNPAAWYRVIFLDADADEQQTEPVFISGDTGYTPNADEVAVLLRARTRDDDGNDVGVFNDRTTPTRQEADEAIREAEDEIEGRLGSPASIPERLHKSVRSIITLMSAMNIELTYFPEQVRSGKSAYEAYERRVNAALGTNGKAGWLVKAIQDEAQGGEAGVADDGLLPVFNFDDPSLGGELVYDPVTQSWVLRDPPPPYADEGPVVGVWE